MKPSVMSMVFNIDSLAALYDILEEKKDTISKEVQIKMYSRIGRSVKGVMMKSYHYSMCDARRIISSIPAKLYGVSCLFPLKDRLLFSIEKYCPILIIATLKVAYICKSCIRKVTK